MSLPLGMSPFYLEGTFSSTIPGNSHGLSFYFVHSSGAILGSGIKEFPPPRNSTL